MGLSDRKPVTAAEYLGYKSRFNNWGRWGESDQSGTLNHIDRSSVLGAVNLIETGETVSCANPIATREVVQDPKRNPRPADHEMSVTQTGSGDYIGVYYHGYVNTHIDSLCHFFTESVENDGKLYNGADPSLITESGAKTHSVDNWSSGIVTRGVLYDIPELRGTDFVEYEQPVEGWDLQDWADQVGVTPRKGDAVLIRSGYSAFWAANPDHEITSPPKTPGNAPSILEYLYETDASLLGWDLQETGFRSDQYPARIAVHEVAIPHMGMPLLDNADFDALAEACKRNGRYEFHITIAPLVIKGGTGSPVNPIVTF